MQQDKVTSVYCEHFNDFPVEIKETTLSKSVWNKNIPSD
jgi:hypothetical protein